MWQPTISLQRLWCVCVLKPQVVHSEQNKETILKGCQERISLRGVQRVFKVSCQMVAR